MHGVHYLCRYLKTGTDATAWQDTWRGKTDGFFIVGVKEIIDGKKELPHRVQPPYAGKINTGIGIECPIASRDRGVKHFPHNQRTECSLSQDARARPGMFRKSHVRIVYSLVETDPPHAASYHIARVDPSAHCEDLW